jgi:hypothetical protein
MSEDYNSTGLLDFIIDIIGTDIELYDREYKDGRKTLYENWSKEIKE